jgi:hypothetical protein
MPFRLALGTGAGPPTEGGGDSFMYQGDYREPWTYHRVPRAGRRSTSCPLTGQPSADLAVSSDRWRWTGTPLATSSRTPQSEALDPGPCWPPPTRLPSQGSRDRPPPRCWMAPRPLSVPSCRHLRFRRSCRWVPPRQWPTPESPCQRPERRSPVHLLAIQWRSGRTIVRGN